MISARRSTPPRLCKKFAKTSFADLPASKSHRRREDCDGTLEGYDKKLVPADKQLHDNAKLMNRPEMHNGREVSDFRTV